MLGANIIAYETLLKKKLAMNYNLPAKIMLQAYVLVQLNSPKSKMREAFIMV